MQMRLFDFFTLLQPWHTWLVVYLLSLPGVGRRTVVAVLCDLLQNQTKPDQLWGWGRDRVAFAKIYKNADLLENSDAIEQFYNSHINRLKRSGVSVVVIGSKEYPKQFYSCDDPPSVLYAKGNLALATSDLVAVVGSRKMTGYGTSVTRAITRQLVADGYSIVSGGMYGVDECAHREVLAWDGETIAVLGYGFDHSYPARMRFLCDTILEKNGLLLSEYLPEVEPRPGFFVERNRIIAGLSQGVVVTEAAQRSGSHSTAICAAENGRAVFAVPGAITNPYSEGTKWLINQGATLITSGYEVSEALGKRASRQLDQDEASELSEEQPIESKITALLQQSPLTLEQLAAAVKESLKTVIIAVSQMEIRGELVKDGILWYPKQ